MAAMAKAINQMTMSQALGRTLQELRLERTFTAGDIATGIRCHKTTVHRMERGFCLSQERTRMYAICLGLKYHQVVERAEGLMRK